MPSPLSDQIKVSLICKENCVYFKSLQINEIDSYFTKSDPIQWNLMRIALNRGPNAEPLLTFNEPTSFFVFGKG